MEKDSFLYKHLIVWQKAMDFLMEVYGMIKFSPQRNAMRSPIRCAVQL